MPEQFDTPKETIFITYEDVIKSVKLFIVKKLLTDEYKPYYKDFIDYSKIENKTDDELMAVILSAPKSNILEYLATSHFDYEVTYLDLMMNNDTYAKDSKLLSIGQSIYVLLSQSFTDKIYIYTAAYDESIHKDLSTIFDMTKVVYINGDFNEVIADIHKDDRITSYIVNNIEYVKKLLDTNMVAYTTILLANYGYNYKMNEEHQIPELLIDGIEKLGKEKIFKFGVFDPYNNADYSRK